MSSIIRRRRGLTVAIWGSPVSGVGCTPRDPGRREITLRQIHSPHLGSGLVQSPAALRRNTHPDLRLADHAAHQARHVRAGAGHGALPGGVLDRYGYAALADPG